MSLEEFNRLSPEEQKAYLLSIGETEFPTNSKGGFNPLVTDYRESKLGVMPTEEIATAPDYMRNIDWSKMNLNPGNPVAVDANSIGKKIYSDAPSVNPAGIATDANGNEVSILKDRKTTQLNPLAYMYNQGQLGYMNPNNSTPSWFLNKVGAGISNVASGKGVAGGIGIGAGILGAALSGTREVMAGMGSQNIQNFMEKEGKQKWMEYINSSMGQEFIRNKQANGYSGAFQEGGMIGGEDTSSMPSPQEILAAFSQMKGYTEDQTSKLMEKFQKLDDDKKMQLLNEVLSKMTEAK